ncbi:ribose-phosphate diphosphokinase [Guggenheimella bovis]
MHRTGGTIKIFTGNSNLPLAKAICDELDMPLGEAIVTSFSDGEISISIQESFRGADCFVVQSIAPPDVNRYLVETLILLDAMKRGSAGRITAVIPYYGYARQDRKVKARDPISAKLVADILTRAGADRILALDLHAAQIQGYFNLPVDHLVGRPILARYIAGKNLENMVVVAPDFGSVRRARDFAAHFHAPIAIIEKRRPRPNESEVMGLIGDVKGKSVVIIDDIIDTAGTITEAANYLLNEGALEVYACASHAVFSGKAIERLKESAIKEVVVLDSIALTEEKKFDKLTILSSAKLFAEAIERIYHNDSVSEMFESGV